MLYYIKILLVLCVLTLVTWFFVADYLPDSLRKTPPGRQLDRVTASVSKDVKKFIRSLEPGDYYDKIHTITASQLIKLIKGGIEQNHVMLIYIYSFDAQIDFVNFEDIVDLSNQYDKKKVKFITVALEKDKQLLSERLNKYGNTIDFPLLQLPPEENKRLLNTLNNVTGGYGGAPYMVIVNKSGIPTLIRTGLSRKSKIDRAIENAIKGS